MLAKNYCPISLLPVFGKMFERVIYNSIFTYFLNNKLITPSQSGFLPGDSCTVQLLAIIHEIHVRRIFSDMSKVFDKVWLDGIIS